MLSVVSTLIIPQKTLASSYYKFLLGFGATRGTISKKDNKAVKEYHFYRAHVFRKIFLFIIIAVLHIKLII